MFSFVRLSWIVPLFFFANAANAAPVTYDIDISFSQGGSAVGWISLDPDLAVDATDLTIPELNALSTYSIALDPGGATGSAFFNPFVLTDANSVWGSPYTGAAVAVSANSSALSFLSLPGVWGLQIQRFDLSSSGAPGEVFALELNDFGAAEAVLRATSAPGGSFFQNVNYGFGVDPFVFPAQDTEVIPLPASWLLLLSAGSVLAMNRRRKHSAAV